MVGYRFPFDKFELYAGIGNRDHAAVPLFLVEDQEANIWDYHQFTALDSDAFLNDDSYIGDMDGRRSCEMGT